MRVESNTSGRQAIKGSTIARASKKTARGGKTTATAVFHLPSSGMTSKGKQPSCDENTQATPFSRMLALGSTSSESSFSTFLKSACKGVLEESWLPTETDCVASDLSCLSGSLLSTTSNSWFSNSQMYLHSRSWLKICSPSSQCFRVEFTDCGNTVTRCRKIRVYPTEAQKAILESWSGCSRYAFNRALEHLKRPGTKAAWKEIKTSLIHSLPDWADDVPYQIKSIAIRDCCKAVSKAKRDMLATGEKHEVEYRSKKRDNNNLFIPKAAVNENGAYKRLLGNLFSSEKLERPGYDCRLTKENGRYYLCVPRAVQVKRPENQRLSVCALDPGVRTFQTVYSKELCVKIGEHDMSRIYRLCYALDRLISRRKLEHTNRYNRAMKRIRWKIRNLVDELHNKTALFLCKTFDLIFLPTFETSEMVAKRNKQSARKLDNKSSREMLTWSHYRFKQKLKSKAEEYSCEVWDCGEAYTSKTCGVCGHMSNIGSAERWKCKHCGTRHDRDINGARNIFVKNMFLALRDSAITGAVAGLLRTCGANASVCYALAGQMLASVSIC